MNEYDLAWGTQFELIRFYTKSADYRFGLDAYRSIFKNLVGANKDAAPKVREKLKDLRDARLPRPVAHKNSKLSEGGNDTLAVNDSLETATRAAESEHAASNGMYDTNVSSDILRRIKEGAASAERALGDPWAELDLEEESILRGDKSGHGLAETCSEGWYGGKGLCRTSLKEARSFLATDLISLSIIHVEACGDQTLS